MGLQQLQILLITIISLLVFLAVAYVMKSMITYQRKRTAKDQKDDTQVGFVVDAFHEMVSKLKEKERELEVLRRAAEERASAIELYNQNIIQSVPSGVVSLDQDFIITRMNTSALKILGLSAENVIGKAFGDVFHDPLRQIIENKGMVERAEIAYTIGSGKRLWIGFTLSPLKDSRDAVLGRILIFTDLTELKAYQSQTELRERLSSLGEMSAGIAHELRNPMGVISGYTQILSKKVDESLRPNVTAIAKEVEVMDRIINDFLTFARPPEPMLTPVQIRDLVEGCISSITVSPDIVVRTDIAALPVIKGDEVLLRQAITNLVRNAVEAMPEGGELSVTGTLSERNVLISVSDSGHGIDMNIRDKIFLPFYTTKERGTGLGLAIVHKIVIAHGGTVNIESSNQGTTFTICLPAA